MMMNEFQNIGTFTLVRYLILCLLLGLIVYKTRNYKSLALAGFLFSKSLITSLSGSVVLLIGSITLSKKTRPLYLLLLAASLLLPESIKVYSFLLAVVLCLEEYLSSPREFGHTNFAFAVSFLFLGKSYFSGPGLSLVGEYLAVIYSLRLIFWGDGLKSSLKVLTTSVALLALLGHNASLDLSSLLCTITLVVMQTFIYEYRDLLPTKTILRGLFYKDPKIFFVSILSLFLGPILLISSFLSAYNQFYFPILVSLLMVSFAAFQNFSFGLEHAEIETGEEITSKLWWSYASILMLGPLGMILVRYANPEMSISFSFITLGICFATVGIVYGIMRIWDKEGVKISNGSILISKAMKNGQLAAEFNSSPIEESSEPEAGLGDTTQSLKALIRTTYFPYLTFLFLVIITSLMLLLREVAS